MSIDQSLEEIKAVLTQERKAGGVNGLEQLHASQARREQITQHMSQVDAVLQPIRRQIKELPALPPLEPILWAQSLIYMGSCFLLEIDTTGLEETAEICRVTLANVDGTIFDDILIRPPSGVIPAAAAEVNGITNEQIADAPGIREIWQRKVVGGMQGRYVVSFAQGWDRQALTRAAERHGLPPVFFLGEDLQKRLTQYYQEYDLKLTEIVERITGQALPEPATARDRVRAQAAIIAGMAAGIYDKRPPRQTNTATLEDDSLVEVDDHPF